MYRTNIKPDTRGICVVNITDTNGSKVLSYSGSYALIIGESDYTAGWSKLNSIPSELDQVESVLKDQSFVVKRYANIESKHALFLFDSCFSGTVFKSKNKPKIPRQITQAMAKPVRQFITAGSADEAVPAKSTFTPAFVDALRYAKADMYKDGYVTAKELGLYLKNIVSEFTEQTPQYGTIRDYDLSRGDFVFKVGGKNQSQTVVQSKVFQDRLRGGGLGPKMVRIPAGSFRMGDIQGGGGSDEQPVHRVSVGKFAMGMYEVTFAEYDKFADATGRKKPDDEGWGRGNRPVINVSWNDATAYAKWLSNQTGKKYRLPTEAEWEYAARAGTETKYWWGNDIGKNRANCDSCGSQWDNKQTAPVGSFSANQFGLYDTVGNLWEWTCSEYEKKYNGKEKQCVRNASRLSLRGGSWNYNARLVRSAYRINWWSTFRLHNVGFRVSRLVTLYYF